MRGEDGIDDWCGVRLERARHRQYAGENSAFLHGASPAVASRNSRGSMRCGGAFRYYPNGLDDLTVNAGRKCHVILYGCSVGRLGEFNAERIFRERTQKYAPRGPLTLDFRQFTSRMRGSPPGRLERDWLWSGTAQVSFFGLQASFEVVSRSGVRRGDCNDMSLITYV